MTDPTTITQLYIGINLSIVNTDHSDKVSSFSFRGSFCLQKLVLGLQKVSRL